MSKKSHDQSTQWTIVHWGALLVTIFGVYLVLYAAAMAIAIARTNHWPVVQGTVQNLEVLSDGLSADFIVSYQYNVEGKIYTGRWGQGNNHGRGNPGADGEDTSLSLLIKEFRADYGEGEPIEVHYNPLNPADTFIEPEQSALVGAAVIGVFGLLFASALPFSRRRKSDEPGGRENTSKNLVPDPGSEIQAIPDQAESVLEDRFAQALTGSETWSPGRKVVFIRPPAARKFLLLSGLVVGGVAAISILMLAANAQDAWESSVLAFGAISFASVGFFTTVAFLQSFWCSAKVIFDWKAKQVEVTVANHQKVHPLRSVKQLVVKTSVGHAELDAIIDGESVVLFDTLDHGFAAALEMPTEHLPGLATKLGDALGVSVSEVDDQSQSFRGQWRYVPMTTRIALVATASAVGLQLFDLGSQPIAFAVLAFGVMFGIWPLLLGSDNGNQNILSTKSASKRSHARAFIALTMIFAIAIAVIKNSSWMTETGIVVSAFAVACFLFVCFCTPDLVMSQRVGVTIPMLTILDMRLGGIPVQRIAGASARLRRSGMRCSIASIEKVQRRTDAANVQALVASVEQASVKSKNGTRDVDPLAASVRRDDGQRSLASHATMLGGALLGLFVIGFFFIVTSGPAHLDNLMIDRNWQETDATILQSIPSQGRDHSPSYVFSYAVNQVTFSARCFGPSDLQYAEEYRARYDADQPGVACLVGGYRADGLPFLSLFFLALSALVIVPLPIVLGHLVVAVVETIKRA